MKGLLNYFDLDERSAKSQVMNKSILISDLGSMLKEKKSKKKIHAEGIEKKPQLRTIAKSIDEVSPKLKKELENTPELVKKMPWWEQIVMYIGVLLGVILNSFITDYMAGENIELKMSISVIIISAVIALVVVPKAFEYSKFTTDMPFIGRLGIFVQFGVFSNVLFGLVGKLFQDMK